MTPYLNKLMDSWKQILWHTYMALCIFYFVPTPLGVICMAPIIMYAYVAWTVDIEEEGFCLAVFVGDQVNEDIIEALAQDCHEQTGRDVKIVIVQQKHVDAIREGLEEEDEIEEV